MDGPGPSCSLHSLVRPGVRGWDVRDRGVLWVGGDPVSGKRVGTVLPDTPGLQETPGPLSSLPHPNPPYPSPHSL